MKLRIDLRIFLFLVLFYITNQINIYVMVLIFAFIHELGHLLAGIILGMKPKKIEMMPTGLSIAFKIKSKDYNTKVLRANMLELKKILVALAGPFTNFAMIFLANKLNLNIYTYLIVVFSNYILLVFNLLPIYPMDRWKSFKKCFTYFFRKEKVYGICA